VPALPGRAADGKRIRKALANLEVVSRSSVARSYAAPSGITPPLFAIGYYKLRPSC